MIIWEVSATASENIGQLVGGVGFYRRSPICRRANRVSENNRIVKVGAYFGNFWHPENLTVGAPLPFVGNTNPKQSCPSVQTTLGENPQTTQNASFFFVAREGITRDLRNYAIETQSYLLVETILACVRSHTEFVLSR